MLLNLVFALIIFSFQYLSFGIFLTKFIQLKLSNLEKVLTGVFLALAINAGLFFLLGQAVGVSVYYLSVVPLLIGILNFKKTIQVMRKVFKQAKKHKIAALICLLGALSLAGTLVFSWFKVPEGLQFQAGQLHDSLWHIALINKLKSSIPPEHPSDFTLKVINYHYFYDLIIAGMSRVYHLDVSVLYFQFFPVVLTSLLAAGAAALGKRLSGLKTAAYLVFLTFFAGSFAYMIPWFLQKNSWHDSSFWVSQTFGMMVNPQNILTFALTFLILIILTIDLKNNKKFNLTVQAALIILIAASLGFKSYSFLILSVLYGVYLLMKLIEVRNLLPFAAGAVFSLFSLPFLWLITGFKTSSFIYKPLWFLDSMVESADRLNLIKWKLLEDHYRLKKNWPRVWEIKIKELLIFYLGNLGIRSISLGLVPLLLFKKIKSRKIFSIILAGFLFSSIFPLLYIQRGVVWNSIQFWYYTLIFANIFAALVLSWIHHIIIQRTPYKKITFSLFIAAVLALSLPTVYTVVKQKYLNPEIVGSQELQLLNKIQPADKVIIHPDNHRYYQTSLVSAFTQAKIVHANPVQLQLMNISTENSKQKQKLINLIEQQTSQLAGQYPQALIISGKKLDSQSLTLIEAVDNELFLYRFNK